MKYLHLSAMNLWRTLLFPVEASPIIINLKRKLKVSDDIYFLRVVPVDKLLNNFCPRQLFALRVSCFSFFVCCLDSSLCNFLDIQLPILRIACELCFLTIVRRAIQKMTPRAWRRRTFRPIVTIIFFLYFENTNEKVVMP